MSKQDRPVKLNPTGEYDKVPKDLIADDTRPDQPLFPCKSCGRKFRQDRLETHEAACAKISDGGARRGQFNASGKKY